MFIHNTRGFRIGILGAFALVFALAMAGTVSVFYVQNGKAITQITDRFLEEDEEDAIVSTENMLQPVGKMVDTVARFAERSPAVMDLNASSGLLFPIIAQYAQIHSFYIAFENGNFLSIMHVSKNAQTAGPTNKPVPEGTVYIVHRLIHLDDGHISERWTYVDRSGETLHIENGTDKASFDPRTIVPYRQAVGSPDQTVMSDPYPIPVVKKPGISFSKVIWSPTGEMIGVVGADVTLNGFSKFLAHAIPGLHGIAMVVDDKGRVLGHPDGDKNIRRIGDQFEILYAHEIADEVVRHLMAGHDYGDGIEHRDFTANGESYIASYKPFPPEFDKHWEIVLAVPSADYAGNLRHTTIIVLGIALLILMVGMLAIRQLVASMTKPIAAVIAEANRMRDFDLTAGPPIKSRITEINALADAVKVMRAAIGSFAHFVPRTLIKDILATGNKLALGGEARDVTVMFTDLADFSTLAETVTPQDLTMRVSDYLQTVSEEIITNQGTIDKYIGDAVMALWNAPGESDDHVAQACRTALISQWRLQQSNQGWTKKGWKPIRMRIGVHTDKVIAGIIGSTEHMSYTALGDGVNIAARLEAINKNYGTPICVSQTVYEAVKDRFLMRPLDFVAVKGRKEPIGIYELMAFLPEYLEDGLDGAGMPDLMATEEQREQSQLTFRGFALWRLGEKKQAADVYEELLEKYPYDKVADIYCKRCLDVITTDRRRAARDRKVA